MPKGSIIPKWKLRLMSLLFWKYKKIKIDDPDEKRKTFMLNKEVETFIVVC